MTGGEGGLIRSADVEASWAATPGHHAHSALRVFFHNAGGGVPQGTLGGTIPVVGVPNQVTTIQIFVGRIVGLGGFVSTNTMFRLETFQYVVGHEVGHGVNIVHRLPQQYPPGQLSVMVTQYFMVTSNINDPAWNNIPHTYAMTDEGQIQVR
ncbi:MAG: hypothetical protein D6723_02440 [Acidobacteria bacterium]|nr:MAG: hypothetical protein D6723_02440 [Acidobacteriota bacterium]